MSEGTFNSKNQFSIKLNQARETQKQKFSSTPLKIAASTTKQSNSLTEQTSIQKLTENEMQQSADTSNGLFGKWFPKKKQQVIETKDNLEVVDEKKKEKTLSKKEQKNAKKQEKKEAKEEVTAVKRYDSEIETVSTRTSHDLYMEVKSKEHTNLQLYKIVERNKKALDTARGYYQRYIKDKILTIHQNEHNNSTSQSELDLYNEYLIELKIHPLYEEFQENWENFQSLHQGYVFMRRIEPNANAMKERYDEIRQKLEKVSDETIRTQALNTELRLKCKEVEKDANYWQEQCQSALNTSNEMRKQFDLTIARKNKEIERIESVLKTEQNEVLRLKEEMEQLRLENEKLQSEMNHLKANGQISKLKKKSFQTIQRTKTESEEKNVVSVASTTSHKKENENHKHEPFSLHIVRDTEHFIALDEKMMCCLEKMGYLFEDVENDFGYIVHDGNQKAGIFYLNQIEKHYEIYHDAISSLHHLIFIVQKDSQKRLLRTFINRWVKKEAVDTLQEYVIYTTKELEDHIRTPYEKVVTDRVAN